MNLLRNMESELKEIWTKAQKSSGNERHELLQTYWTEFRRYRKTRRFAEAVAAKPSRVQPDADREI